MARNITTAWYNESIAQTNKPFLMFEGAFSGGQYIRIWNGVGDISWDSKTWSGNGWIHAVSTAAEDREVNASGMEITLAGVPSQIISAVLSQTRQSATGKLWFGFLNSSGAVVADPYLQYDGKFDTATITESSDQPLIVMKYESELIELERPKEFRFNNATQKLFYPDDRGFEYVAKISETPIIWGRTRDMVTKRQEKEKKQQQRGSKVRRK